MHFQTIRCREFYIVFFREKGASHSPGNMVIHLIQNWKTRKREAKHRYLEEMGMSFRNDYALVATSLGLCMNQLLVHCSSMSLILTGSLIVFCLHPSFSYDKGYRTDFTVKITRRHIQTFPDSPPGPRMARNSAFCY
jgi:hypothetical protein